MIDGEERLIKNAIKGRPSAFGSLYDHYQPKIYRFVLIKVGRREEAEDLTHQVFLHAWQNIRTYEHLGFPFSSWLYQIARNQVVDHYRTKRNEANIDQVAEELIVSSSLQLDTELNLELDRVRKAIQKLKPEYQDVIVMRFVEDLSIKEVAVALGKSEGAVKLMQHRALKELRNVLETTHSNG
ncbi:sigma-70 family RNA polymerase sigma factor [Candidatus Parcubacteria bacterium]|nr:MAG: sigma-70 family RNA polymerase sigma factor [Candidatus Parcubacteria bacterium]